MKKIIDNYRGRYREPFETEVMVKPLVSCRLCVAEKYKNGMDFKKAKKESKIKEGEKCLTFMFTTGPVGFGCICKRHAKQLLGNLQKKVGEL